MTESTALEDALPVSSGTTKRAQVAKSLQWKRNSYLSAQHFATAAVFFLIPDVFQTALMTALSARQPVAKDAILILIELDLSQMESVNVSKQEQCTRWSHLFGHTFPQKAMFFFRN